MGTRLLDRGLDLRIEDPAHWNLTRPGCVSAIHERDIAAGADAVLTNTFGANRCWLARYRFLAGIEEINRAAVALARQAAGHARYVIGCMGPTAAAEPAAAIEQAEALLAAGVDALLLETCLAPRALALMEALRGLDGVPRLVSLSQWPEPLADTARSLVDLGAMALGGNCQPGMGRFLALAAELHRVIDVPLLVKPNAGLPGQAQADPASFAACVPALLARGVRLLGGCCGTTEAHVAALRGALPAPLLAG